MSELISVNGAIAPPGEAVVPALDRGFLFGDGVYETIRTYGGRPFLLAPHLERLALSAAALDIPIDRAPVDIGREVARALAAAGNEESAVRVVLSRGAGPIGYDPGACGPPTVVIYVRPLPPITEAQRREGVDVAVVRTTRNASTALDPAIKSSNLLNNFLAWREARRLGAFEPILLNPEGRLAEGASSNLFVVAGGRIATPPLEAGILAGITRRFVLDLCRRHGLEAAEAALGPDDLRRADEAFLTSTLKGVLPIRRCDGWPIHDGRPGPVTRRLAALYESAVQEEMNSGSAPAATFR